MSTYAFTISGAYEVVRNWLEICSIAVLIPPDRKRRLSLYGRFLASIVGRAPTNNRRPPTDETFLLNRWLWQTNGNYVFRLSDWLLQNHNCTRRERKLEYLNNWNSALAHLRCRCRNQHVRIVDAPESLSLCRLQAPKARDPPISQHLQVAL